MPLEDSIINGIVTFGVLGASIFVYIYLEKRKYMLTKKIEVYSEMTTALKKWFMILPEDGIKLSEDEGKKKEKEKAAFREIGNMSERLLFYGSTDIYRKIFYLFTPIEGGSRIHTFDLNNLIIDMIIPFTTTKLIGIKECSER